MHRHGVRNAILVLLGFAFFLMLWVTLRWRAVEVVPGTARVVPLEQIPPPAATERPTARDPRNRTNGAGELNGGMHPSIEATLQEAADIAHRKVLAQQRLPAERTPMAARTLSNRHRAVSSSVNIGGPELLVVLLVAMVFAFALLRMVFKRPASPRGRGGGLDDEEAETLWRISADLDRMEKRIENLETILMHQTRNWDYTKERMP